MLLRLAHYKGLDGKFRLFRYGHWIPAQWREFHELYEFARTARLAARPAGVRRLDRFGARTRRRNRNTSLTLLLMRLDSGKLHARPGRMGGTRARRLGRAADARAAARRQRQLSMSISRARTDCGGRTGRAPAGGCSISTPARFTRASSSACACLPEHDEENTPAGEIADARAEVAADAARGAVRTRRARLCAARAAQRDRSRSPSRRRPAGADARGRRSRASVDRGEVARRDAQLRRDHANGESERQPRFGRAPRTRFEMAYRRPQRDRLPAGSAVARRPEQTGRDHRVSRRRRLEPRRSCAACSDSRSTK